MVREGDEAELLNTVNVGDTTREVQSRLYPIALKFKWAHLQQFSLSALGQCSCRVIHLFLGWKTQVPTCHLSPQRLVSYMSPLPGFGRSRVVGHTSRGVYARHLGRWSHYTQLHEGHLYPREGGLCAGQYGILLSSLVGKGGGGALPWPNPALFSSSVASSPALTFISLNKVSYLSQSHLACARCQNCFCSANMFYS